MFENRLQCVALESSIFTRTNYLTCYPWTLFFSSLNSHMREPMAGFHFIRYYNRFSWNSELKFSVWWKNHCIIAECTKFQLDRTKIKRCLALIVVKMSKIIWMLNSRAWNRCHYPVLSVHSLLGLANDLVYAPSVIMLLFRCFLVVLVVCFVDLKKMVMNCHH